MDPASLDVWFLTGSQALYGPETLRQVEAQSSRVVAGLGGAPAIPVRVVPKPVLTTADAIQRDKLLVSAPGTARTMRQMRAFCRVIFVPQC